MVSGKIHIIGNPPFGKQSSLCHKFIKHCATFADTISFILPATFIRRSLKNKVPLNFSLQFEKRLPAKAFSKTNAQCVFQI